MKKKLKIFLFGVVIAFLLFVAFYLFSFLSPALNLAGLCGDSGDSGDINCCTPNCAGKTCGNNGCSGTCGTCSGDYICENGICAKQVTPPQCISNCAGKTCGNNGCGGSCGTCSSGQTCNSAGQCITDNIGETVEVVIETPTAAPANPVEVVAQAAKEVKKIIETPQGSAVTKTVSTAGAAIATAQVAAAVILFPFDLLFMFLRLLGIFLIALGLKKRVTPWGVVYDSVTKQPIDPAYVVLKDLQGKTISSAITDLDGRYGFLKPAGVYQMSVNKTNYAFPSQKLLGKTSDELYDDLYFGQNFELKKDGQAIIKNIPMDPLRFDWNEFAKKDKRLMKFYSRIDIILRQIFDLFFVVGFVVALVAYFAAPYPYNLIILIIYLALLFLRIIGVKPKTYGRILDFVNGDPLSFAVLRVITPDTNIEIAHKVADKYGRYYCLVPKGKYFIKIEKKDSDGSYSTAFVSPAIDASKTGIIKNNFRI